MSGSKPSAASREAASTPQSRHRWRGREVPWPAMYRDDVDINIRGACAIALQIANPVVIEKVERLAKRTGLSKTAVVERALDGLIAEIGETSGAQDQMARLTALLAQLDRIPDLVDATDPLDWDELGLPR